MVMALAVRRAISDLKPFLCLLLRPGDSASLLISPRLYFSATLKEEHAVELEGIYRNRYVVHRLAMPQAKAFVSPVVQDIATRFTTWTGRGSTAETCAPLACFEGPIESPENTDGKGTHSKSIKEECGSRLMMASLLEERPDLPYDSEYGTTRLNIATTIENK